jgi:hypothetical protein
MKKEPDLEDVHDVIEVISWYFLGTEENHGKSQVPGRSSNAGNSE